MRTFTYNVYEITGVLQEINLGIRNAKPKPSNKPLETAIKQLFYIAKAFPQFHDWLQCMDILSWYKRRISDGISDMQEMLKSAGFDLPLAEAWQTDFSPLVSITSPIKSSNEKVSASSFGVQPENIVERLYTHSDERQWQQMYERIFSSNLIVFSFQSDRELGILYTPACDKVSRVPIAPTVSIMGLKGDDDGTPNLAARMFDLTVFESLREQVASGKGLSCFLRHQYGGDCCGGAGLIWSIYEAGRKAMDIKELGWKPTKWDEPECSKTNIK